MSEFWPWACLFLVCSVFTVAWFVWRRAHRIVSERLTWASTAVGVGFILAWLSLVDPDHAGLVRLAFIVGGGPAVLLGIWSVVEYMLESARGPAARE